MGRGEDGDLRVADDELGHGADLARGHGALGLEQVAKFILQGLLRVRALPGHGWGAERE